MKLIAEHKTFILQRAVEAAVHAAHVSHKNPVDAAMHVACAGLIAHKQLSLADDEAEQIPSDIEEKVFVAAGFSVPSVEVQTAMRQLGLTPLLRATALHSVLTGKAA